MTDKKFIVSATGRQLGNIEPAEGGGYVAVIVMLSGYDMAIGVYDTADEAEATVRRCAPTPKKPTTPTLEQVRDEATPPPLWMVEKVWNHLVAVGYIIKSGDEDYSQAVQDAHEHLQQVLEDHKTK